MSYSRKDQDRVARLLSGLRRLDYQVWYDQELSGGQEWWDTILAQIRGCDVALLAVSSAGLESKACRDEIAYARQLGKPVLPVMVEPVPPALLPQDLALLQLVDYTGRNQDQAIDLMAALKHLPPPGPLPDPLPPPPEAPTSYLNRLSEMIEKTVLNEDEQYAIIGRLEQALDQPEDREFGVSLLRRFDKRRDLYRGPARNVETLLAGLQPPPPPAGIPSAGLEDARSSTAPPAAAAAGGTPGEAAVDWPGVIEQLMRMADRTLQNRSRRIKEMLASTEQNRDAVDRTIDSIAETSLMFVDPATLTNLANDMRQAVLAALP